MRGKLIGDGDPRLSSFTLTSKIVTNNVALIRVILYANIFRIEIAMPDLLCREV